MLLYAVLLLQSMIQKWSREIVIDKIIEAYEKGRPLTHKGLIHLTNGIYYKGTDGSPKYFSSLKEARQLAAEKLAQEGRIQDAQRVLAYNGPQRSSKKFTDVQKEQRRKELIDELKQKIADGEDVRYRSQQATDRRFENMCHRAFGTYDGVFRAAGLDYAEHASHIPRKKEVYLDTLVQHIKDGHALDKLSMAERDSKLVKRLSDFYCGYYTALAKAHKIVFPRASEEEILAFIQKLNGNWRAEQKAERQKQREKSLEKIVVIESAREYSSEGLPLQFDGLKTGSEISSILANSEDWLSTPRLSGLLQCTDSNVRINLKHKFADRTIAVVSGRRTKYYYHRSASEAYKKKNVNSKVQKDSVRGIAAELGLSYTRVRGYITGFGIDIARKNGRIVVEQKEVEIFKAIIEREKKLLQEMKARINPEIFYSVGDLDMMGVSWTGIYWGMRKGTIPFDVKDKVRIVGGQAVLDYLSKNEKHLRVSQVLQLISHFYPHLYTVSDLVQALGTSRSNVAYRLETLLEENPEACFSLRKSEERKRIIATKELMPFLENWGERAGLQLVKALPHKAHFDLTKGEMQKALRTLEQHLEDTSANLSDWNSEAFKLMDILKGFEEQPVLIGDTSVANRDLALIHRYMVSHEFYALELGKVFTPDDIRDLVTPMDLLKETRYIMQYAQGVIYQRNLGIVTGVMKRMLISPSRQNYEHMKAEGDMAILKAIRAFKREKGFKFSTLAFTSVKYAILRVIKGEKTLMRNRKTVSLDKALFGDDKLSDYVADTREAVLPNQELSQGINDLLSCLSQREKEIITRRFGINVPSRETLDEIGKSMKLTRERIRQIEKLALEKLQSNPNARMLREGYLE